MGVEDVCSRASTKFSTSCIRSCKICRARRRQQPKTECTSCQNDNCRTTMYPFAMTPKKKTTPKIFQYIWSYGEHGFNNFTFFLLLDADAVGLLFSISTRFESHDFLSQLFLYFSFYIDLGYFFNKLIS